jgi:hypothetical protein
MTSRLLTLSRCASLVCGCANIPFFKPSTPPAETLDATSNPVPPAAEAEDSAREAALRALPEDTVVIGEEQPGILTHWSQSIFKKGDNRTPHRPRTALDQDDQSGKFR